MLLIYCTRDGGNVPTGSPSHVANYGADIVDEASETQENVNQKVLKTLGGVCKIVITWMRKMRCKCISEECMGAM
jgi:hypothetical protein